MINKQSNSKTFFTVSMGCQSVIIVKPSMYLTARTIPGKQTVFSNHLLVSINITIIYWMLIFTCNLLYHKMCLLLVFLCLDCINHQSKVWTHLLKCYSIYLISTKDIQSEKKCMEFCNKQPRVCSIFKIGKSN